MFSSVGVHSVSFLFLRKTCRYHTLKMNISSSVMQGGHTLSVNIYALTVGVFA